MSCRAALVVPALLASCGWTGPEEQVLSQFFNGSRLLDTSRLHGIALAPLEPRVFGTVQRFDIERAGAEERRAATAPADEALAVMSLTPPGSADVDLAGMTVEIGEKQVVVDADMRTPDGSQEPRTLTVTMQRAIGRRGEHAVEGRWIVTAFR